MNVRWSAAAADDLEAVTDYLFEKTPANAARLVRKIFKASSDLNTFPNRGRTGKAEGARELIVPSLPYVIVYQVTGEGPAHRADFARCAGLATVAQLSFKSAVICRAVQFRS